MDATTALVPGIYVPWRGGCWPPVTLPCPDPVVWAPVLPRGSFWGGRRCLLPLCLSTKLVDRGEGGGMVTDAGAATLVVGAAVLVGGTRDSGGG